MIPFLALAPTAVAAKKLGRNYLGCEIDAHYLKAAKSRLKLVPNLFREMVQEKPVSREPLKEVA